MQKLFEICQAKTKKTCSLIFNRAKTDILLHSPVENISFDTFKRIFYLEASNYH